MEIQKIYPLSPMQEGMLFHSLYDEEGGAYFEQIMLRVNGQLDLETFEKSFNQLLDRHEVLRTIFLYEEVEKPRQIVLKKRNGRVNFTDISHLSAPEKEEYIVQFKADDRKKGFDLSADLLIRVSVLALDQDIYEIIWSFHHIIMDGWCISLILDDFNKIYTSLALKTELNLTEVRPYSTYIKWLDRQNREEAASYWEEYLSEYAQQATLPRIASHLDVDHYIQAEWEFSFDQTLTAQLANLAKANQVTINTVIQAMWGVMLQQYNNTSDVVFGSVVSGRPSEIRGIEQMVGLFINTIPVRISASEDQTFAHLLQEVQTRALQSGKYDYYPLPKIQATTSLKQDLIDHILVFENFPVEKVIQDSNNDSKLPFKTLDIDFHEQTSYNLDVTIIPGEELLFQISYNSSVYDQFFVRNVEKHLKTILTTVLEKSNILVQQIPMVGEKEKTELIYGLNQTQHDYPAEKTIHQLFEEQVAISPDQVAVIYEDQQLTYRELNERANQLARVLRSNGVQPNQIVALMAERSPELVIGIMGVLKAGGAYLPIDPGYPAERVQYILDDSQAELLLTQSQLVIPESCRTKQICLDESSLYEGDCSNLDQVNRPEDLVYIIYTSGSTGKPKGVMVEQQGLVNYVEWAKKVYLQGESAVFPLYSSIAFDLTVTSIYTPLVSGNQLLIYGDSHGELILEKIITDNRIDIIKLTPAHLRILQTMEVQDSKLRRIIVGGEELKRELAETISQLFNQRIEIYNEYGPTETVVGCMIHKYDPQKDQRISVPIGVPADNVQIYLLDQRLQPTPHGVPGEMYISGHGVARGYLNRPELTAQRFMTNPFVPGTRMYKTGDLAVRLADQTIEFWGRLDRQVKIRGYRIELGEIETYLKQFAAITDVVVIDRLAQNHEKHLCAYLVSEREVSVQELRGYLEDKLPDYMIPAYFVRVDQIPLTINGKVDRDALPEVDGRIETGTEFVAPTTEVEARLAQIWAEVLQVSRVGINDNFFELGGDSIMAIQLISKAREAEINITVKDVFDQKTIRNILENTQYQTKRLMVPQEEITGEVLLTPIQKWFFEQNFAQQNYWNQNNLFYLKNDVDLDLLEQAFMKLIEHHDALRMGYKWDGAEIVQFNRPLAEVNFNLELIDLSGAEEAQQQQEMIELCQSAQEQVKLENSLLIKALVFDLGAEKGKRLFITAHHLIIDGVSWRILLADLDLLYNSNLEATLPLKTTSFQDWSYKLDEYSKNTKFDLDCWQEIDQSKIQFFAPAEPSAGYLKDYQYLAFELTAAQTDQLLTKANLTYNTEINDILLAALNIAFAEVFATDHLFLTLEGHGREEIMRDVDISRTIGWFTSQYPILLTRQENMEQTIKHVKELIRKIPKKGIDFGIARYLTNDEFLKKLTPEIIFNYLGQFDNVIEQDEHSLLSACTDKYGTSVHPANHHPTLLDITGMIMKGKLQITLNYNPDFLKSDLMAEFQSAYQARLGELIEHCITKEDRFFTESDLDDSGISQEDLDLLAEEFTL